LGQFAPLAQVPEKLTDCFGICERFLFDYMILCDREALLWMGRPLRRQRPRRSGAFRTKSRV